MTRAEPLYPPPFQTVTVPDAISDRRPCSGLQYTKESKRAFNAVVFFWVVVLMVVVVLLAAEIGQAGTPITLYRSLAGSMNYVGTGGSLRTQPNTGNACAVTNTSAGSLAGVPAGALIQAAYLYWAGSYSTAAGSTLTAPDYDVTFEGQNIAADRVFSETFVYNGIAYDFFSGVSDVTALVAARGNGLYTFADLSANTGTPHCAVQAVVAGWALVVIYEHIAEPLRVVNVFDGFQYYRGNEIVLNPSNFNIPASPIDGRHSCISWEGDLENSAPLNGFTENLLFNGTPLIDSLNPLNNQFNSTINFLNTATAYGVDFDVYDISPYLGAGDTSAVSAYRSGGDLVLLSAEVISVTNTPVADLAVHKSHIGTFTVGQNGIYRFVVSNRGPNPDPGPITVTDTLPAGLTYVDSSGAGWTVDTTATPTIVWTHPGPLVPGQSLPTLTLTTAVDSAALPSITNTVSVTSPTFDNSAANDIARDATTVLGPAAANKPLYLYGDPGRDLSRTPPPGIPGAVQIRGGGEQATWSLTPPLAKALTLAAGSLPVKLWIERTNQGSARTVNVALASSGATSGPIGAAVTRTFTIPPRTAGTTEIVFNLDLGAEVLLAAGSQINLIVTNETPTSNYRIRVVPVYAGNFSTVGLNANSLISIDSVSAYDAPYPGGVVPAYFAPGATAYVRVVVSDPFGSFDIDRTAIDLVNPDRVTVVFEDPVPEVDDNGADAKVFEYAFAIPADGTGTWTARIRTHEGTEAIVNDVAQGSFVAGLPQPDILFLKTTATLNDPFNGSTDPKAIPGAQVLYILRAVNQGPGTADSDSVVLTDPIPPDTALYVNDLAVPGSGPVAFADGPTASGLTYLFGGLASAGDDLAFSDDNGATYGYTPTPGADGFDPGVTHVRITPRGAFLGVDSSGSPSFEVRYKVRIR